MAGALPATCFPRTRASFRDLGVGSSSCWAAGSEALAMLSERFRSQSSKRLVQQRSRCSEPTKATSRAPCACGRLAESSGARARPPGPRSRRQSRSSPAGGLQASSRRAPLPWGAGATRRAARPEPGRASAKSKRAAGASCSRSQHTSSSRSWPRTTARSRGRSHATAVCSCSTSSLASRSASVPCSTASPAAPASQSTTNPWKPSAKIDPSGL
mmetsp:Transcript_4534/g.13368  ORF Transcript_4534/g.13368 Transcript_4534/m.13368 type:complete len:214 (+) Transcript_4534:448-1089(+)